MDWTTGRYENSDAPAGERWRVVIAGDWAPRHRYAALLADEPESCYGNLLPLLRDNDLRIVNVETVLGSEGTPIPKNGPHLSADPATIASLTSVPWDVATLCNNHVFDHGPEGLKVTIERLQAAGLATVGAGLAQADAEATLRLTVKGQRVAIVNAGEGEENRCKDGGPGVSGFDEERLAARVRDLRETGHVVIAIIHAGREYVPVPPPYIHRWYRRLADAGAHLVVGGHPHVPQGVEVRNGCPICYSTSNFLFWFDQPAKSREGYVVQAEFVGDTLAALQLLPYQAEPEGIRRMTPAEQTALYEQLRVVSEPLRDPALIAAHWEAYSEQIGNGMLDGLRRQLTLMETNALAGAENLRNYLDTPAHRELILTWLRLIMEGRTGQAAPWAVDLLAQWAERATVPA
ncbi:MAG: CapA family protein [Armatimonadetes bacterium]|nr:CapA family protein [Armatimonadota bacterium]